MRGVWLEQGRVVLREDLPSPELRPGEALLRLRLAGICATDLELVGGYLGFCGVPGHEFVAEVLEAPSAPDWEGARVVGEINTACGTCATCLAGRRRHCPGRDVLGLTGRGGAFAEELALPLGNLHRVPASIPDAAAVFAEPLAAALEIQEQVPIASGDRVVVIGPGKLGHLVAQSLAATGCGLLVVGRRREPLALLAARGIRTALVDGLEPRRADVVVECTGNPDGLEIARRAVRPRGTIVLKSTYHGAARVDLAPFVVDEITIVGSRCGPFGPALALLARGTVDPRPLVEARYPLEEAVAAFEHAARPGARKILLECR
jgi:threonine dehydrogenase-like Zn-dependent dehydrogenase